VRSAAGGLQSGANNVNVDFHIFTAFDQLLGFAGFCTVYVVKVKVILQQATKAQKESGVTALLFL
jgi:hypothetical protein